MARHKADCTCAVCVSTRAGEIRRELGEQALATYRAAARAVLLLTSRMTGLPAPDAVAALAAKARGSELDFNPADLLKAAGIVPRGPAGSWAPGEHRPAASQSRTNVMWQESPDYDPRVVKAIIKGATDSELNAIRGRVAAELAESRAAHPSGQRSVMWHTRTGEAVTDGAPAAVGASFGPSGAPVQRSQIHHDVPELGSE